MAKKIATKKELLALRAGTLSFDDFARSARENVLGRARYFMRRWRGQVLHDEEDLAQDALLAIWRAVDSWDPERRSRKGELVQITRYVDYHVGKALERKLRKALGWPAKGRREPAKRREVADIFALLPSVPGSDWTRTEARQVVLEMPEGLEREVALGVVDGRCLDEVAAGIYSEVPRRLAMQLDSGEHAARTVRAAARRAQEILWG